MKLYRYLFSLLAVAILAANPAPTYAQQDSTRTDSLLQQVKQQMGAQQEDSVANTVSRRTQSSRNTSATTNPDISVIGDFQLRYMSEGDRNWDTYLNGVELNFSSVIDPYARADIYPVFEGEGGDLHVHLEEAYLTTLSLPLNLQVKAGKFRQQFGRMNLTHRHALPVIDVPVAYETFLGEAMIDQGLSVSWLVPNPAFYQELILDVTQGPGESPLFAKSEGNAPQLMMHFMNFWSLTENATLQLGLSGALGENEFGKRSRLGGVDISYIWKPVRYNTYRSLEWQTEFFFSGVDHPGPDGIMTENSWGMYSYLQYQLSRRWYLTGLYSYGENPMDNTMSEQAVSATLAWYATEFQKLEIGPKLSTDDSFGETAFSGLFRWVFVIGTHGAHEY